MQLLTELKDHQKNAVDKLIKIKIGALYLEQGTGKTRTALELIKEKINKNKVDRVLWLCPCSVKSAILQEFDKHIKGNHKILTYGIESLSSSIRLNQFLYEFVQKHNVYIIIDESNLVKNHRAKRTENIQRLADLCKYKLILNGTPLSRNEADLYSQWKILDWRILGYKSFYSFAANHLEYDDYGRVRRCLNTDYLTKKIAPYSYQVKKSECTNLTDKDYRELRFNLTAEQYKHYEDVKDRFLMQVDEYEPYTLYRLFTALQHVTSGNKIISKTLEPIKTIPLFKDKYDNPRIDKLYCSVDADKKYIIWCKFTHEIKDISEMLREQFGFNSVVEFYGKISKKKRAENIERFRNEANFFVANKTCAGYGLNLQFCNRAIYYNNDWDYATRIQSEDRIHRIGQDRQVFINDIYSAFTIDDRILSCLNKKERLVNSFKYYLNLYKKDNKVKLSNWIDNKI